MSHQFIDTTQSNLKRFEKTRSKHFCSTIQEYTENHNMSFMKSYEITFVYTGEREVEFLLQTTAE